MPQVCDWCGATPAELYEVGRSKTGPRMAYACRKHRERFDEQRAQREEAVRQARAAKRQILS